MGKTLLILGAVIVGLLLFYGLIRIIAHIVVALEILYEMNGDGGEEL